MSSGSVTLPQTGGGSGGGVNSINGDTSSNQFIVGTSPILANTSLGTTTISLTVVPIANGGTGQSNQQAGLNNITDIASHSNGDVLQLLGGNAQFAPFTAPPPTGNSNTFAGFDGTGLLESIPGWGINSASGADVNINYQPNNLAQFYNIENLSSNVDPLQASPNDVACGLNVGLNIDPNSTGFDLGTNGTCAYIGNFGFNHHGTSNIGSLGIINGYMDLGNGTDPINVRGCLGYSVFGNINSGVTLTGGLEGFHFAPQVQSGAIFSVGPSFTNAFIDGANVAVSCDGWNSFSANPHLANVANNRNYSAFNANPTIDTFTGNAQATMFYAGGQYPAGLGPASGGYQALQINPNFGVLNANSNMINVGGQATTGTADWTGINIQANQIVSSGNIRGAVISMASTQVAIDSQGHHNLNSGFQLASGQGQQYGNVIGGEIRLDDGTTPATITGTDTLANNMAYSVNTGLAGSAWTAASIVGLTTLGFVGQITGAGTITGPINFCLAGYADAHTGHIDRVNNFHAAAIPTGAGGTMDEAVLFLGESPFGFVATDNWGVRIQDNLENYMDRLAISTANKKVTNASCGIELGGTTQAIKYPELTTVEKLALTALPGMQVFDATLTQMSYYNGTIWVNF